MKFPKNYLKNLQTKKEFEKALLESLRDDLSISSATAVRKAALKKGFIIGEKVYALDNKQV